MFIKVHESVLNNLYMISSEESAKQSVHVLHLVQKEEYIMDSVLAQTPCGCLHLIFATRKKPVVEPLMEVLATIGNMNIK